jgi:hypothetical protein
MMDAIVLIIESRLVRMMVTQKPISSKQRGRLYMTPYNSTTTNGNGNSTTNETSTLFQLHTNDNNGRDKDDGAQQLGLFRELLHDNLNYIVATPASIPYMTLAAAFDYGTTWVGQALFQIRKAAFGDGETAGNVIYHLPQAVHEYVAVMLYDIRR